MCTDDMLNSMMAQTQVIKKKQDGKFSQITKIHFFTIISSGVSWIKAKEERET